MKYQYGDLVKFTNNYGMHAAQEDEGTVQHVDKFGNILVLVESGDFAARFEEVRDEDIELIDRLSDDDLTLLKEELQRMDKILITIDLKDGKSVITAIDNDIVESEIYNSTEIIEGLNEVIEFLTTDDQEEEK